MEHGSNIRGYTSFAELANDVGNLRYDCLAEFLVKLSEKLADDSASDSGRGRPILAEKLQMMSENINHAAVICNEVWSVCKPYMKY